MEVLYITEAYLEPGPRSTMKLFREIFSQKYSIVDVRLGSKCTSV